MKASQTFRLKCGLSVYALACGYQQQIDTAITGKNIRVTLWLEHGAFHVRAHDFNEVGRIEWVTENNITDARTQWTTLVNQLFGDVIKTIKKDRRYAVNREYRGWSDPAYVVRFCGEYVDHCDTAAAAWIKAAEHNAERI